MKTRNTEQSSDKNDGKTRDKSKAKTKVNLNISSTERVCNRCKNHQIINSIKGHKCEYNGCDCVKCKDYEERRKRRYETAKKRMVHKKAKNQTSVQDINAFVKSFKAKTKFLSKNKSIHLLNKTIENSNQIEKKTKVKERMAQKLKRNQNKKSSNESNPIVTDIQEIQTESQNVEENESTPPELVPQIAVSKAKLNSSTINRNDSMANSQSYPIKTSEEMANSESYPIKTSPSVCAQYLKAGEELSRRLSKYNFSLTEDELMGCLKYSLISYCLGDVEMAAQKIIFASNEIRSGALFNIQHPNDEHNNNTVNPLNNQNTGLTTATNVPILNSTFNVNHHHINAVPYSPTFTPIRRN